MVLYRDLRSMHEALKKKLASLFTFRNTLSNNSTVVLQVAIPESAPGRSRHVCDKSVCNRQKTMPATGRSRGPARSGVKAAPRRVLTRLSSLISPLINAPVCHGELPEPTSSPEIGAKSSPTASEADKTPWRTPPRSAAASIPRT